MIKAIETKYRGYRFRSRLEARWAVFFDHIGLDWLYEHEGYVVDGRPYLPDFFIPSMGIVVEIKPYFDPELDLSHLYRLASDRLPVCLFYGLPWQWLGAIYCHETSDSGGGGMCVGDGFYCQFGCNEHRPKLWVSAEGKCLFVKDGDYEPIRYVEKVSDQIFFGITTLVRHTDSSDFDKIRNAIAAAKSARFEHGENGGVQ